MHGVDGSLMPRGENSISEEVIVGTNEVNEADYEIVTESIKDTIPK
jgi:hypothetical protein